MGSTAEPRQCVTRERLRRIACFTLIGWLYAAAAHAQAAPALPIDVHAFASQGFVLSTDNNYLARSKGGSFKFTEVAVNGSKSLSDELRVGMQLFSRKLGPNGNYQPVFDWYYLDYRFADWLGLRAGRTKIPFGLYNESNDVDAGRVPVLLPQSIYPNTHRDILLALTGGELYGNVSLGRAGQLEYRAYGGVFALEAGAPPNPGVKITDVRVRYLVGGRLMWLTPLSGLQVGGSLQALRYDVNYMFLPEVNQIFKMAGLVPADFDGRATLQFPIKLWVISAEYAVGDLLLAAEYGRWSADLKSSQPKLFPDGGPVNERFYAMGSYRLNAWFTPGVYYSGYYENVDKRNGRENYQQDLAATLRFDLTSNWLVKLEGHWMRGTAALESSLNDNKEKKDLARDWGMFLIKTTAYF